MKSSTLFNKQQRALTVLQDIYSAGICFKRPILDISKDVNDKVFDDILKGCPQHTRAYVRGYSDCLYRKTFDENCEFVYVIDGEYYSTWKQTIFKRLGTTQYPLINDLTPRGHVWKGTTKELGKVQNEIESNKEMEEIREERRIAKGF
jgi:hypothetical protein